MCNAPYSLRLTAYPYSTGSGSSVPLPLLLSAHEAVLGCEPFELESAVSRRCMDLDERRSSADQAHIASYTAMLSQLPALLDCYAHMHAEHYHALLAEYGRGLFPPHASYLRAQRKRRVLRWAADERLQSAEQCRSRIERVMQCFSRALHSSPCEYLFSRQPSTADVMLAAYVAFIALAPHDDSPAASSSRRSSSTQPLPSSPKLAFVSLSSLLASHPLLLLHCRLLFDRFFPAFSFQPPSSSPAPSNAAAAVYASATAVADYVRRAGAAAVDDAGTAEERIDGAAALLSDLRGRLSERPLPRGQYIAPLALPMRGGDQWVEQAKASLSAEERERMVQRSRRMWLLGGAALVLAFVLWQRSKVNPATTVPSNDTATMAVNTS